MNRSHGKLVLFKGNSRSLALAFFSMVLAAGVGAVAQRPASRLGEFTSQTDVGVTPRKGSAEFDAVRKEYRVRSGGANMW